MVKLKPLTRDQIQGIAASAVKDAVAFIESEIAPDRVKAQRYFNGEVDLKIEKGRSAVKKTVCRDAVRAIKPSLMRVFLSTDKAVEYVPRGPDDVPGSEQATKIVHYKLEEMGRYMLLTDAFHDALTKKTGILKVFYEKASTTETFELTGLSDDLFALVAGDPEVVVVEHSIRDGEIDPLTGMPAPIHDAKVQRTQSSGDCRAVAVPPEELFVDRNARSCEDYYVIGHRTEMRMGDVLAMGFTEKDLEGVGGFDAANEQEEDDERRRYTADKGESENAIDPSMRLIGITEAYMRLDADGTGKPVLHRIIMAGAAYKLLSYEPIDDHPFVVFEVDPEPHAFFGRSLIDLIIEDQDVATSILRGILDNVHMTNNPRLGLIDGQVNIGDAMNGEIGAMIRMRQAGAIFPIDVPFTAGQTLGALQYVDAMVEEKTGITKASMGLDPDAMQSTTRAAVAATVQAAAGQVETIARNLAESGMRRLFKILLRLITQHQNRPMMMRLTGGYVEVDPRAWNATMDVTVNVGLGTGREDEKAAFLDAMLGFQQGVLQAYGMQNGLVTMTGLRNAWADRAALVGVRSIDRYLTPMDAGTEAALQAQQAEAAAQQPPASDPSQMLLQAEQMKAQAKMQSDAARMQADMAKAQMADDRERDRMTQELELRTAEILAKYGATVDTARIKAEQAAMRPPPGAPVQ